MSDELSLPVDRLPTLTEVLELGREGASAFPAAGILPLHGPAALVGGPVGGLVGGLVGGPVGGAVDLVGQVLALLEPRVGALLEARLREALAPALARAADGLIRDVRAELAPTLRSLVEEAVAQAQRAPRPPQ